MRNYAKRVLQKKLDEVYEDLHIECKLTTLAELKKHGLYGNTWKTIEFKEY